MKNSSAFWAHDACNGRVWNRQTVLGIVAHEGCTYTPWTPYSYDAFRGTVFEVKSWNHEAQKLYMLAIIRLGSYESPDLNIVF